MKYFALGDVRTPYNTSKQYKTFEDAYNDAPNQATGDTVYVWEIHTTRRAVALVTPPPKELTREYFQCGHCGNKAGGHNGNCTKHKELTREYFQCGHCGLHNGTHSSTCPDKR